MDRLIYTGDAGVDAPLDHGWLIGHFKPETDLRRTDAFEVKWGVHEAGDRRSEWVRNDARLTTMILVSGCWSLKFERGSDSESVVLERPGAYVVWAGVDHSWEAIEDTVIITVRSPSIPGYQAATVAASHDHHQTLPGKPATSSNTLRQGCWPWSRAGRRRGL